MDTTADTHSTVAPNAYGNSGISAPTENDISDDPAATHGLGNACGLTPSSSRTWMSRAWSGSRESWAATCWLRSSSTPRWTYICASSACSAAELRRSSLRSTSISARADSFWLWTDTYSPVAIENAPPTRPASPASVTACRLPLEPAPATPAINAKFETRPSIIPNTVGRNHPPETSRCWWWTSTRSLVTSVRGLDRVLRRLGLTRSCVRRFVVHVAVPQEPDQRADEHDDRRPVVQAQSQETVGIVAAHRLNPEPSDCVAHGVQGERIAPAEPPLACCPDEEQREGQVPQRLVQERRVVVAANHPADVAEPARLRPSGRHVAVVDRQPPRHVGRPAVQLVVEPVAPPPDRLRRGNTRRRGVGEGAEPNALAVTADPRPEHAQRNGTPDAKATVPDLERVQRMFACAEVLLVVGNDVVEPSADDAHDDGPERDVPDVVPIAAAGLPPARRNGERYEDAGHDAQRVCPDRDRSEVPDRARRAGDRSQRVHAATVDGGHQRRNARHGHGADDRLQAA